jgi:hypothetical protein
MRGKCSALPWSTRNFELCRWAGSWLFGLEQNQRTVALTALWVSIGCPKSDGYSHSIFILFSHWNGLFDGYTPFWNKSINHRQPPDYCMSPRYSTIRCSIFFLRFDGRDTSHGTSISEKWCSMLQATTYATSILAAQICPIQIVLVQLSVESIYPILRSVS